MKISSMILNLTNRAQELAFPNDESEEFVSLCIVIDENNGDFIINFDLWERCPCLFRVGIIGDIVVTHSSLAQALILLEQELDSFELEQKLSSFEDDIEVEIVKNGRTYRLVD